VEPTVVVPPESSSHESKRPTGSKKVDHIVAGVFASHDDSDDHDYDDVRFDIPSLPLYLSVATKIVPSSSTQSESAAPQHEIQ
jgi:hypothetical protein